MESKGGRREVAPRLGGGWMGGAIRRGLIGRFAELFRPDTERASELLTRVVVMSTVVCLMQVGRKGVF